MLYNVNVEFCARLKITTKKIKNYYILFWRTNYYGISKLKKDV